VTTRAHADTRPSTPATLVTHWRTEAMNLRAWGAQGQADALDRCAAQLDAVLTERDTGGGAHG
jgi:hypothetical protein